MKYRADMIAGTLSIDSARGRGTTVTCSFPNPAVRRTGHRSSGKRAVVR